VPGRAGAHDGRMRGQAVFADLAGPDHDLVSAAAEVLDAELGAIAVEQDVTEDPGEVGPLSSGAVVARACTRSSWRGGREAGRPDSRSAMGATGTGWLTGGSAPALLPREWGTPPLGGRACEPKYRSNGRDRDARAEREACAQLHPRRGRRGRPWAGAAGPQGFRARATLRSIQRSSARWVSSRER
jgi:hypothetical protein